MSERRRAGALVVPKTRPPADRSLLRAPGTVDHQSDSWRVMRFISEFVEGFGLLAELRHDAGDVQPRCDGASHVVLMRLGVTEHR